MNASEEGDLRALMTVLDQANDWTRLTSTPSAAWDVAPGSALAGDDSKTDPYHVSHRAMHARTVAVDHLNCLRSSLMVSRTGTNASIMIHTHGQSSLVR